MHKLAAAAVVAIIVLATARLAAAGPEVDERKNPGTATMLALAGTGASVIAFATGVNGHDGQLTAVGVVSSLVTPSLGHWYAGVPLTWGMAMRAVGGVGAALALRSAVGCECAANGRRKLFIGGFALFGVGVIYDILTASHAAERYNVAHARRVRVAPTVLTPPSGPVIGVGVGGSF